MTTKIRLGLTKSLVDAPAFDDINDLFVPAETVLKKAGGFSRGPKAGHRYWRRQRVIVGGKLRWRYYYNTEKDKARWLEDRAKLLKRKRGSLSGHEQALKRDAESTALGDADRARLKEAVASTKKELSALTVEFVNTLTGMKNPPNIVMTDTVREEYMKGIERVYEGREGGEPEDPHGNPIHALRMLQHAYNAIPGDFMQYFDGDIKTIRMGTKSEIKKMTSVPRQAWAAFCSSEGGGFSSISCGLDSMALKTGGRFSRPDGERDQQAGLYGMKGGAFAVEVMIHEMAHAFHNRMGAHNKAYGEELRRRGWKGALWEDWEKFVDAECKRHGKEDGDGVKRGKRGGEIAATKYGQTNSYERWAEGFTGCLLYPHQMAARCPKQYDWFRDNVFGHAAMNPRVTDKEELARLKQELKDAKTADERRELRQRILRSEGLDEVPRQDERFHWWLKAAGKGQTGEFTAALSAAREGSAFIPPATATTDIHRVDPPDMDKIGQQKMGRRTNHDRFYEVNHKGRTVYFRYGPSADGKYKHWEPDTDGKSAKFKANQAAATVNIKECYDEKGNPIHPDLMYLHLVQDDIDNGMTIGTVKIRGKNMPVTTDDLLAFMSGNASAEQTERVKKVVGSEGKTAASKFLRKWTQAGPQKDLKALQDLYAQFNTMADNDPEREAMRAKIDALELKVNDANWDQAGVKGGLPAPVSMQPHEVTLRQFKQRSGTFAYDNISIKGQDLVDRIARTRAGTAQHRKLLDELRKVQPGIAIVNRKDPKTGRFQRGNVKLDRTGRPVFNTLRYVNENPDGSQTVIDCTRDPKTGKMTISNPMWRDLLTPNGEEIRDAADLTKYMRIAASDKKRAWVSLRTDRERIQTRTGRYKLAKRGDTGHHFHVQLEFDGKGSPRLVGNYWKQRLGVDDPRLDMLIKDDPVFGKFREGARAIIEGEAIRMKPEEEKPPFSADNPPKTGELLVLSVTGEEQRSASAKAKDVVARLVRVIPGKKKGELPPPPGWDSMPEGMPTLMPPNIEPTAEFIAKKIKRLPKPFRLKVERLKKDGLLPQWYTHSPEEAEWYRKHFAPAYKEWDETKETFRQEERETQYIFMGEKKGGAVNQTFSRAESVVMADIRRPAPAIVPERLKDHVLAYQHHTVDPRTGLSVENEIRLLAPASGNPSYDDLMGLPGCTPVTKVVGQTWDGRDKVEIVGIRVKAEDFRKVRSTLGGLSITDAVNRTIGERYQTMRAAEVARRDESHVIESEEIDPANLARTWGVKLNETLPNGAEFRLGIHQQKLLQKMLDNDGRVLAAHYMGTGKTISALSAAQIMLRRPYRPECPKDLVGEERQQWLEQNPWDTSRLHPDNPKRVLVVAPLNTVEQWRQAAYDFDDGAQVVGSGSNDIPIDQFVKMSDASRAEVVVVGPEHFTLHADALKKCGFDGLVIDEVHQGIKNEAANRNKVVREWNPDMKMLMLLTGTPMTTHPADFVEYVRLLSKGTVWGDMTKAKFIAEFCMESDIPSKLGEPGAGPKVKIRPEKMPVLAGILSQYMDIAMSKDVRGKTLPATRVEEGRNAVMRGVQEGLYNLYMGRLGSQADAAGLTMDEIQSLKDGELRRRASAAKALTNCIGYKPGDSEPKLTFELETPTGKKKEVWTTPSPAAIMSKKRGKSAGKWPTVDELRAGDVGEAYLTAHCQDVLGVPYDMLAGKPVGFGIQINGKPSNPFKLPVSKAQREEALRRMKAAGWPRPIDNPDFGPLGVAFRGHGVSLLEEYRRERQGDLLQNLQERLELAKDVQREFRMMVAQAAAQKVTKEEPRPTVDDLYYEASIRFGVSQDEVRELLRLNPNPTTLQREVTLTHGGVEVDMKKGMSWVSDPSGSRHLLYDKEDWDEAANAPKAAGPVTDNTPEGQIVSIADKRLKGLGFAPPAKPKRSTFTSKSEYAEAIQRWERDTATWAPPKFQLVSRDGDTVRLVITSGKRQGQTLDVPAKDTIVRRPSLMDPGKRASRRAADLAMVHQNGKADELQEHIERFFDGQEPGVDGERQMVLFGNGILDSCRTMEAKLRQMGFVDVNEAIEGSPHFDPDDPVTKGDPPSPTGKYFVTYIGSTYTGNRELNVSIFQKVKDKLNRDSKVSLFVHKCMTGRSASSFRDDAGNKYSVAWQSYPGDISDAYLSGTGVEEIRMAQWTADQREVIKAQFGIKPPEAFLTIGAQGSEKDAFFYGKDFTPTEGRELAKRLGLDEVPKRSGDLLRAIALAGDPARLSSRIADLEAKKRAGQAVGSEIAELKRERADIVRRIEAIKRAYTEIARDSHTTEPPLTKKQETVFNNCEAIVCSDAAQVGMNLGNSVEMVMYDSLGSPMAEAQRMTRCARMLPSAVPVKLMGTKRMIPKTRVVRDSKGLPVLVDGKPKTKPVTRLTDAATAKIGDLRNQMEVTGVTPARKAELAAEIEKIRTDKANREPVMVQATDELGRPIFENDGPFSELRRSEAELFGIAGERSYNPGTIANVTVNLRGEQVPVYDGKATALPQVLDNLNARILKYASDFRTSPKGRGKVGGQQYRKLLAVAARCQSAAARGATASADMLEALRTEVIPGTTEPYISFDDASLQVPDPEAGTYGGEGLVLAGGVTERVRDWIDSQDDTVRDKILNAGFTKGEDGEATSHDAAAVYLAIRAQEILTWIEDNRSEVATEMRSGPGGDIVTDNEVTNRLIDSLTPMDRAILKEKKYLVNVRKLAAGGNVGQTTMYKEDADSDPVRIFTGYEREYPVSTESRTRATQRARARSLEEILKECQDGVAFVAEGAFTPVMAADVATASVIPAMAKSWALARAALVFDLDALEAAWTAR